MKQFVLQPFNFGGIPVVVGQEIEIDDARIEYFTSQGLVGDEKPAGAPAVEPTEEKPEGTLPPVEKPTKPTAKPKKGGKK